MSFKRKSRSEQNEVASSELTQKDEEQITPRQQVDTRVQKLRSKAFSSASVGLLHIAGAMGQAVAGDRIGVTAALDSMGVDRPIATVVGLGCAAVLGGAGVGYMRSALEQTMEAQALRANLVVHDMAVAEQAAFVAAPQPELVWRGEQAPDMQ